ncbi:hypothetical protein KKB10_05405 [Patescibacteria group bacterium]|nr:hypothetical protein [Patescibacteria group bacterium]MBU1075440.1 hypothetical protein [Patescibacteria group bacterium]MBU1952009.1 hypothetical protein [Patescibacteria group bacterium]
MKKLILFLAIVLLVFFSWWFFIKVGMFPNNAQPAKQNMNIHSITLEENSFHSNGFKIEIDRTGDVNYEKYKIMFKEGEDRILSTSDTNINSAEWEQLTELINQNNFWSLDDRYEDKSILDGTSYVLTIGGLPSSADPTLSDLSIKSVYCYATCPDYMRVVISSIEEIANIN